VFDGKSLRETAARRGLAGGVVGAGASGLHTIASRGFPGVAGSKENALRGATAVAARLAPVQAQRWRRGGGVGTPSLCGNERAWVLRRRARARHTPRLG
jgi:hypothetical protein